MKNGGDISLTSHQMATKTLLVATICLLLGRGWQHLFDSVPVRALLWNDTLFKPFVEGLLGVKWTDYVTNLQVDRYIDYLTYGFGVFYLIIAIWLIYNFNSQRFVKALRADSFKRTYLPFLFSLTTLFLFILGFCYYLDKNYLLGQWGEYALQWMTPVFLSWWLFEKVSITRLVFFMKIALAITFICHGLYAIGYYPVPGSFQSMLMKILPLSESQALMILQGAGILDFVISILIFLPYRKIVILALVYAIIWGFLTALARPVANFYAQFWLESLLQWTPEFLFRAPHFLIPACLVTVGE